MGEYTSVSYYMHLVYKAYREKWYNFIYSIISISVIKISIIKRFKVIDILSFSLNETTVL